MQSSICQIVVEIEIEAEQETKESVKKLVKKEQRLEQCRHGYAARSGNETPQEHESRLLKAVLGSKDTNLAIFTPLLIFH